MDKYKKITDLGLKVAVNAFSGVNYVKADDLLKVLDAGVEVYGNGRQMDVVKEPTNCDTHSALLINIKPLAPKQVTITREDLIEAVKNTNSFSGSYAEKLAEKLGL